MTETARVRFRAAKGSGGGEAPLLGGRLRRPTGTATAKGLAVLTHPHPDHGGNMDVWLLPTIGERLAEAGWAVLRFDLRGVGASEGRLPDTPDALARAACDDLRGALAFAREQVPQPGRTALVGWSFGALLGLLVGPGEPDVTDWVGVATPTRPVDVLPMPPVPEADVRAWPARRIAITGEHDQFFPPGTLDVVAPVEVHVLPGADHFLFDRDDEVADLVAETLGPA